MWAGDVEHHNPAKVLGHPLLEKAEKKEGNRSLQTEGNGLK